MEREKITKDIGSKKGDLLIFGGAYSNLQALEKMKQIAEGQSIPAENVICTGDVVGYCAQPEEVVQLVRDWGIHSIAGNVEIQLREGEEDCGCDFREGSRCDTFSKEWYPFAKTQLSNDSIEWVKELPDFITLEYGDMKGGVVHGSFFETSGYIFKSTEWSVKKKNVKALSADFVLAGHCGLPFSDVNESKYWLNPGVIGMPANDGTTRVWYMILRMVDGELGVEHHSFEYDYTTASKLMKEKDLPKEYALTLKTGIWDNTEILPEEETEGMGKRIVL